MWSESTTRIQTFPCVPVPREPDAPQSIHPRRYPALHNHSPRASRPVQPLQANQHMTGRRMRESAAPRAHPRTSLPGASPPLARRFERPPFRLVQKCVGKTARVHRAGLIRQRRSQALHCRKTTQMSDPRQTQTSNDYAGLVRNGNSRHCLSIR